MKNQNQMLSTVYFEVYEENTKRVDSSVRLKILDVVLHPVHDFQQQILRSIKSNIGGIG